MRCHLGGMEVRIHPLLPLYLLLTAATGQLAGALSAFLSVLLHECGHLIAAKAMGLKAFALDVMPMGGVVRICGLYRLKGSAFLLVAAAGPAVSLLAAWLALRLPQWFSFRFACVNLLLCGVNLLPALPLDGGRICTMALKKPLGVRRSVRLMCLTGVIFGSMLLLTALWFAIAHGHLLLPAALLGVYMIAGACGESDGCGMSPAGEIARLMDVNRLLQPQPVQIFCPEPGIPPDELLRHLRPDRFTLLLWQGEDRWETDLQWLRRAAALDTEAQGVIR